MGIQEHRLSEVSGSGLLFFSLCNDYFSRQVLVDLQENPKASQEHMKNPLVMNKIQKLISSGIVQIK